MQLICTSISHQKAPVELRECFNLPEEAIGAATGRIALRSGRFTPLVETVILSTCNRLEIYALLSFSNPNEETSDAVFQVVLDYFQEVLGRPMAGLEAYFRRFSGIQAVEHIYRVAAGLDSIAIGETQILGQVSRALETGLRTGSARHVLSSLFRAAIHVGKRIRTETEIGRRPTSVSTVALQWVEETLGPLEDLGFLVVGAGKMGSVTLEALRERGAARISLANRSDERAAALASETDARIVPFRNLVDGIEQADVVFLATAAPHPILSQVLVEQAMSRRAQRPLVLVDLSVPRNVAPQVREMPGVRVLDMDGIQSFARTKAPSIAPDLSQAEAIVAHEVADYEKLLRVIPFIGELHKKVEDIRQREVEKVKRRLGEVDPEVGEQIDLLSRSLVRKILHEPTMHLRTENNQETLNDYVDALARLFDLNDSAPEFSLQDGRQ